MDLRISNRAQREIDRQRAWWQDQRPAAPTLFIDELAAIVLHITTVPHAGAGWPTPRHPAMRRILMPSSRNHLYFVVDDVAAAVVIHAVWGASKRRGPKL